jgi:hypothetical protein
VLALSIFNSSSVTVRATTYLQREGVTLPLRLATLCWGHLPRYALTSSVIAQFAVRAWVALPGGVVTRVTTLLLIDESRREWPLLMPAALGAGYGSNHAP